MMQVKAIMSNQPANNTADLNRTSETTQDATTDFDALCDQIERAMDEAHAQLETQPSPSSTIDAPAAGQALAEDASLAPLVDVIDADAADASPIDASGRDAVSGVSADAHLQRLLEEAEALVTNNLKDSGDGSNLTDPDLRRLLEEAEALVSDTGQAGLVAEDPQPTPDTSDTPDLAPRPSGVAVDAGQPDSPPSAPAPTHDTELDELLQAAHAAVSDQQVQATAPAAPEATQETAPAASVATEPEGATADTPLEPATSAETAGSASSTADVAAVGAAEPSVGSPQPSTEPPQKEQATPEAPKTPDPVEGVKAATVATVAVNASSPAPANDLAAESKPAAAQAAAAPDSGGTFAVVVAKLDRRARLGLGILSLPLRSQTKAVRSTVGWLAVNTLFWGACVWVWMIFIRQPALEKVVEQRQFDFEHGTVPQLASHEAHDEGHGKADAGHGKADAGHGKADDGHGKADDGHGKADDGHGSGKKSDAKPVRIASPQRPHIISKEKPKPAKKDAGHGGGGGH